MVIPDSTAAFRAIYDPGLNRSSQQCVRELNLPIAGDGVLGFHRSDQSVVTRLSSRRLARRAGRSGDSRARVLQSPRIMRGLKRYIAREVYATLRDDLRSLSPSP